MTSVPPISAYAAQTNVNSTRRTIKRVVISKRGGPDVLKLIEEPMADPAPHEVRVRVEAAGVAFVDVLMREGVAKGSQKMPFVPGYDIVGTIDAVGSDVVSWQRGQRVAALTMSGGYGEYLCVPADALVPVPDGVDAAEAVALVLNFLTAYQMLHRCKRVRAGERVLIHGAGGGVGDALLQLGKLAGLQMFGTASKRKHAAIAALGAVPIDYQNEDFVERMRVACPDGVDLVCDPIGGKHWARSFRTLSVGGMLIGCGFSAATQHGRRDFPRLISSLLGMPRFHLLQLFNKTSAVMGYNVKVMKCSRPQWYRDDLSVLMGLLAQGEIRPRIAERLPLADATRAHQMLDGSDVAGKLVLVN
jgi:NADPH:quinone reductase-like Zn-dependent oxidoreductase